MDLITGLKDFNLNTFLSLNASSLLWTLFGVVFVVYAVCSIVLIFHWNGYGLKNSTIVLAEIIYFAGSVLFLAMALSAIIFI